MSAEGEGQPPPPQQQQLQQEAFVPEDFCDEGQFEILSLGRLSVSFTSISLRCVFPLCFPVRYDLFVLKQRVSATEEVAGSADSVQPKRRQRARILQFLGEMAPRLLTLTDGIPLHSRAFAGSVRLHG